MVDKIKPIIMPKIRNVHPMSLIELWDELIKEEEMKSRSEFLKEQEQKQGTYVGVRFSEQTKGDIAHFMSAMNIPNPIDVDKLHTTLIYSRKSLINFVARGRLDNIIEGKFTAFDTWDTQDGQRALVMEYTSPELTGRNKEITMDFGATSDYPEYKVHLTLSYDIGENDIILPDYDGVIEINEEYNEALNLEWIKSK